MSDPAASAKAKAQALIDASHPATAAHPYLARKQVNSDGLLEIDVELARQITRSQLPSKDGNLQGPSLVLVPIYLDGELSTAQLIDGNGRKHFLAGGKMTGGYWSTAPLPDSDWCEDLVFVVGEGVATVISPSMAKPGHIGVAAMSCGNLLSVGKSIRERYSHAKIIFIADLGIGVTKSTEAALAVKGFVAIPEFPEGVAGKDTNDLHVSCGALAVKACVEGATEPGRTETVTVDLTKVVEMPITWIMEKYLPKDEATLWTGAPGVCKTLAAESIAAAVSTGRRLPGNSFLRQPAHVILVNYEDSISKSMLPRLRVAGADLSMIHPIDFEKCSITLPDDWQIIESEIQRWKAELVVIDPIQAFFARDLSSNNDADVRKVLRPGVALARKYGCAMLWLRHTNKLTSATAQNKGAGSIGFTGIVRMEFMLGKSQDDEDGRIIACVKSNLGRKPPARSARIEDRDGVPLLVWGDEVDCSADDLADESLPAIDKGDEAKDLLRVALADGQAHRQQEICDLAKARKIGWRTVEAAKKDLGVKSRRLAEGWAWCLPASPIAALRPCGLGTPSGLSFNNNNKLADEGRNTATPQHRKAVDEETL